jgi:branched-chain amino acid aminotransferase
VSVKIGEKRRFSTDTWLLLCHSRAMKFGQQFTEHLVVARYRGTAGWSDIEVVPFGELELSPAAMVLHYGQAIFEGLKAYRQPDGAIALFRPDENGVRFDRSARRLAMPPLPDGMFLAACRAIVEADAAAVPSASGESLYLRPVMVATEAALGVRPADEYLFTVMASPAGPYFPGGLTPINVLASEDYVRAAPGGTGAAKCSGNYAASLIAKRQATERGCDEALWLDAIERRWVEELGGMNFVAVNGSTIVTPPAGDTILDGVTRKSLLTLAPTLGYETVERPIAIDELTTPGAFTEAFACGTAAVIVPIGAVHTRDGVVPIADGEPGAITVRLREALLAVQEGRAEDQFGWRTPVTAATYAAS